MQGPWTVTGNDEYVVFGGEFTRVSGQNQQGLVRFGVSTVPENPTEKGPRYFNATYPIKVTSTEAGAARINWSTNRDDDNESLDISSATPVPGGETQSPPGTADGVRPVLEPLHHGIHRQRAHSGAPLEYRVQTRDR